MEKKISFSEILKKYTMVIVLVLVVIMFAGKLVRYIAMLWALQGAISMMNY